MQQNNLVFGDNLVCKNLKKSPYRYIIKCWQNFIIKDDSMKKLIKKMLDLYKEPRYKSIVNYIFFGVCTTLVNVVTYFILYYYGMEVRPANLISITLSILFAYFVNAKYVFNSKAVGFKKVFYELSKFFTARLSTLVIEVFGVELFIYLGMNAYLSKFIIQFVVLVANYVISKFLVFTKEKNN